MKNVNYNLSNASESKNLFVFKVFASLLLSAAVIALWLYVAIRQDVAKNALSLTCIGLCFLLSVVFIRFSCKKIFISIALALSFAAALFWTFAADTAQNNTIWLCLVLAVQFVYFLFTLTLFKGFGAILANAAVRVVVCLVTYFVLTHYFVFQVADTIALMYICNSFVSLLWLLFAFRQNWLMFLGFLLFFAHNVCVWLTGGAAKLFGISANFVDAITKYNLAFYFYFPAILLIALSSVWLWKKQEIYR